MKIILLQNFKASHLKMRCYEQQFVLQPEEESLAYQMMQDLSMIEWLRARNNHFEWDVLKEGLTNVVDSIWLKCDECYEYI